MNLCWSWIRAPCVPTFGSKRRRCWDRSSIFYFFFNSMKWNGSDLSSYPNPLGSNVERSDSSWKREESNVGGRDRWHDTSRLGFFLLFIWKEKRKRKKLWAAYLVSVMRSLPWKQNLITVSKGREGRERLVETDDSSLAWPFLLFSSLSFQRKERKEGEDEGSRN